jgi:starch phosphorylase
MIVGYGGKHINTLRLWSGQSGNLVDLEAFDRGDYQEAVGDQIAAESISRVLYPNDATPAGLQLRLKQEYFFTAASLMDLVRRHLTSHDSLDNLADHVAIQLNDTHPAIAVPELLRLLVDEHDMPLKKAFGIVRECISYTNHTLLPEALERWPVQLMEQMLPRHMQLIYDINAHVLDTLRHLPGNDDPFLSDVSLIEEGFHRSVRMGHLAFVGAHKVNGVSALHTELMKQTVFKSLHRRFPDKITNKTNGITPRRWLMGCNPGLSALLDERIGKAWRDDLSRLHDIEPLVDEAAFQDAYRATKRQNKVRLSRAVADLQGLRLDPDAMFDIQIKRIHEYKRQLLNIMEAIALFEAIRAEPKKDWQPRVKLFGGKAAPSYNRAKLIIKLINDVAAVVNNDAVVGDRLKIVFLPNYNVSLAELMIPAADLSEQISTAGMEASGTGNMKFALNGALTVGTLDGANVEMREHVGAENFFIFGMTADQVLEARIKRNSARAAIEGSPRLARVLQLIEQGRFSPDDPGRFRPIVDDLRNVDYFMVAVDFDAYYAKQREIDQVYGDRSHWTRMAALNTARMVWFSSDRTIAEYADEIWRCRV